MQLGKQQANRLEEEPPITLEPSACKYTHFPWTEKIAARPLKAPTVGLVEPGQVEQLVAMVAEATLEAAAEGEQLECSRVSSEFPTLVMRVGRQVWRGSAPLFRFEGGREDNWTRARADLYAGMLVSSIPLDCVDEMLVAIGMGRCDQATYYEMQRGEGLQAATALWNEMLEGNREHLRGKTLTVETDSQWSQRRDGEWCRTTVLEHQTGVPLARATMHKSEVGGKAIKAEGEGTRRCCEMLKAAAEEKNFTVDTVVKDACGSATAIFEESFPHVLTQYDMWHLTGTSGATSLKTVIARVIAEHAELQRINNLLIARPDKQKGLYERIRDHVYFVCDMMRKEIVRCAEDGDESAAARKITPKDKMLMCVRIAHCVPLHFAGCHSLCERECEERPAEELLLLDSPAYVALMMALSGWLARHELAKYIMCYKGGKVETLHRTCVKFSSKNSSLQGDGAVLAQALADLHWATGRGVYMETWVDAQGRVRHVGDEGNEVRRKYKDGRLAKFSDRKNQLLVEDIVQGCVKARKQAKRNMTSRRSEAQAARWAKAECRGRGRGGRRRRRASAGIEGPEA